MSSQILSAWPHLARRKRMDRRSSVRFTPSLEIECHCELTPGGGYISAKICDISAGGICMVVKEEVLIGSDIHVEIINEPHTFLCTRFLHVIRSFNEPGGECVVAGKFDHNLEYDELLPFVF